MYMGFELIFVLLGVLSLRRQLEMHLISDLPIDRAHHIDDLRIYQREIL
jgi:hypothetical protein